MAEDEVAEDGGREKLRLIADVHHQGIQFLVCNLHEDVLDGVRERGEPRSQKRLPRAPFLHLLPSSVCGQSSFAAPAYELLL